MAQDFWASSGYRLLERTEAGLVSSDAWLARFPERDELRPPDDAGPRERAMHARLAALPRAAVSAEALADIEDADARENWTEFLRFRDRVLAFPTLEACYLDLFRRPAVDLAPPFVDALAQAIVRDVLEGIDDPWLARAGELFFRRQRVSTEGGKVLAADEATIQVFAETGGFGGVGRLLRQQNTPTPAVQMDVLKHENAQLYFLRDELHAFVLELSPGSPGAAALARVLERWLARLAGVAVTIEPLARIDDERWRWHIGLDVDASAILDSLYRGESVEAADLERLALLFRLTFHDAAEVVPEMAGRPVYLGLACRPDRSLKLKPQNLLVNLPLARAN
ncbi:MAG TPA: DUF6352 family protein [Usitatibacter sp.]|nr:DUF6352 family protein [Usitatibacter sp.]